VKAIVDAKKPETRARRVEKAIEMLLAQPEPKKKPAPKKKPEPKKRPEPKKGPEH